MMGATVGPTFANRNVTLSNCVYSGCPPIIVNDNVVLSIQNCSFINWDSTQVNGFITLYTATSSVQVTNSAWSNGLGTVLNLQVGGTLNMTNVNFTNIITDSPTSGGSVMDSNSGGTVILKNVFAINVSLSNNAGAYVYISYGTLLVEGGGCFNVSALSCGCMEVYESTMVMNNFISDGSRTLGGDASFIKVYTGVVTITNLIVRNSVTASYSALSITTQSTVSITNALFDNNVGHSGSSIYSSASQLTLQNVNITNSKAIGNGGSLYCDTSTVTLTDVSIYNSSAVYGGAIGGSACSLSCTGCTFSNNTALFNGGSGYFIFGSRVTFTQSSFSDSNSGINCNSMAYGASAAVLSVMNGYLSVQSSGFFNNRFIGTKGGSGAISVTFTELDVDSVTISNSSGVESGAILLSTSQLYARNLSVMNCKSENNGGAISGLVSSLISFSGETFLSENSASFGGAISLVDETYMNVSGSLSLIGNNAMYCGGALFLSSTAQSNVNGQIISSGNSALNLQSSLGCIFSTASTGILSFGADSNINNAEGLFYIDSPVPAGLMQSRFSQFDTKFGGKAGQMFSDPSSLTDISLGSSLPDISVTILDYFGNANPLVPNETVIIQLVETNQNAKLLGTTIGVIEFPFFNTFVFSNVQIKNPVPGNYSLLIKPLANTLFTLPNYVPIQMPFKIDSCTAQQFWDKQNYRCVPYLRTNSSALWAMIIVSVVILLSMSPLILFMFNYQTFAIIKSNSFRFLLLVLVGSMISLLSVTVFVFGAQIGCTMSAWLENIGFFTIMGSLILKMYRIKVIFTSKQMMSKGRRLNDAFLLRYLSGLILLVIALLSAWSVLTPPTPVLTLIYDSYMTVDRCSSSTFSLAFSLMRLIMVLIASVYAYMIRDIPSSFNESKSVGFSAYNWVIFGTLISLLADYAMADPTVGFLVRSCSIFVPNILTVAQLIAMKVYQCMFHPEVATVFSTGTMVSTMAGKESKRQISTRGNDSNMRINHSLKIAAGGKKIANSGPSSPTH